MVNYTGENKSKAVHNDNYVDNIAETKNNVSCRRCAFCGKNNEVLLVKDKLLCAKHLSEIPVVKGAGTCDKAKLGLKWYNFISLFKKNLAEKSGFDFKAR